MVIVDGLAIEFENKKVVMETQPLQLQINKHRETICIDIAKIAQYNIILGIPWLKKHNPKIN